MTSKPSLPMSNFIKPVSVIWDSSCKSCRKLIARPKNWGNKSLMTMKKLIRFFTIRIYYLYEKLFERSWLAVNTTILWLAILALKRLANCWTENTNGQSSAMMSRPIWKATTFVWPPKQSATSPMEIFNCCLYQYTNRRTFW